jgi:hypothetical protein
MKEYFTKQSPKQAAKIQIRLTYNNIAVLDEIVLLDKYTSLKYLYFLQINLKNDNFFN